LAFEIQTRDLQLRPGLIDLSPRRFQVGFGLADLVAGLGLAKAQVGFRLVDLRR
jgi:hypothetical protein